MKKTLIFLVCILPALLLGTFYVCRLGFHMRDANIAGILMIVIGALLSLLTPLIIFFIQFFTKPKFKHKTWLISSCFSAAAYWIVSYMDIGKELHRFIAA